MENSFKLIKKIIKTGVEKGDFPGAHYCLIENGKVKCSFDGYKQLYPSKIKLDGNEVYDVASLSKVIVTTTLILQLIEKKKINFQTKIKEVLKEYKHETTIYEMLTHQSGLPPIISNSSEIFDERTLVKKIYEEKLIYEPQKHIVYSDVGYKILGFIVEKLYDKSLNKVAQEKIFNEIEMKDTTYRPEYYSSVPTEYRNDKLVKGFVKGFVHDERSYLLKGVSGHAGVFSTAKDISKFIVSILENEKILSQEMKEKVFLTTLIKKDLQGNSNARSIGYQKFLNMNDTHKYLITHTGFTGCNMWIDNKNKRGFVLLSNAIHPKREENKIFKYRKEVLNIFYK